MKYIFRPISVLTNILFKDRKIASIWGVDVVLYGAVPPILILLSILAFIAVFPEAKADGFFGVVLAAFISIGVIFLYALILFGSVVLHELSHIKVAFEHDIPVNKILLTPIGGFAHLGLSKSNTDPNVELPMALAGPTCSAAIAGTAALLSLIPFLDSAPLTFLRHINLVLAVFNLIPAYPMDGGRILRSLLARRLDAYQSTVVAQYFGFIIFVGAFLPIGLFTDHKMFLFIGIFLGLVSVVEIVSLKKALTNRFRLTLRNKSILENFARSAKASDINEMLLDLETNKKVLFLVTCEILSIIVQNENRYDFRICEKCNSKRVLCSRYDDSFELLRRKAETEIKEPA